MKRWTFGLWLALSMPAFALPPAQVARLDRWATDAIALARSGDREGSMELVKKILRKDPDHPRAVFAALLAGYPGVMQGSFAGLSSEQLRRAYDLLMHVSQAIPETTEGQQALAVLVTLSGTDTLVTMPSVDCPGGLEAYEAAEQAFGARDFDTAVARYEEAVAACPRDPVVLTYAGDGYHGRKQYAEAIALYERAIEQAPCFWVAHRFIGDVSLELGDEARGLTAVAQAVGCNPEYEFGWKDLHNYAASRGATLSRPRTRSLGVTVDPSDGAVTVLVPPGIEGATGTALATLPLAYHAMHVALPEGGSAFERRVTALEQAMPLVEQLLQDEGLDLENPHLLLWRLLAQAHTRGLLPAATMVLTFDRELLPDLLLWHEDPARRAQLAAFVQTLIVPEGGGGR